MLCCTTTCVGIFWYCFRDFWSCICESPVSVGWHLAVSHKYNSNSLAAVLHINKSNAAGNSKRLYSPVPNPKECIANVYVWTWIPLQSVLYVILQLSWHRCRNNVPNKIYKTDVWLMKSKHIATHYNNEQERVCWMTFTNLALPRLWKTAKPLQWL